MTGKLIEAKEFDPNDYMYGDQLLESLVNKMSTVFASPEETIIQ